MPVKTYKPTSPGRRGMSGAHLRGDHQGAQPERSLVVIEAPLGRAQMHGRVTVRHRGGGARRYIRRSISSATSMGCRPRWPPSSMTPIGLRAWPCCTTPMARSATSWRRSACTVGDTILAGPQAEIRPGNSLPLASIPLGTQIHNIELKLRQGWAARSVGGRLGPAARQGRRLRRHSPSVR